MSWLMTQPRLTQVYTFTVARLNDCGIRPNGAVIKPWIREEMDQIDPVPTKFECEMVLVGMVTEGVRFQGDATSADRFAAEPLFAGSLMGKIK